LEENGEMLRKVDGLRKRMEEARLGGGLTRIERQHEKGKLTARERLERLLDPGSFVELDALVTHRCTDFGMERRRGLGDGVVTGHGTVDERLVYVYAQDFTFMGGSLGEMHAKKICKVMDLATMMGAPIIGLNDSGGARIQEGVAALSGISEIFSRNVKASGIIPQITAILGPCAGGAVLSPALADFVLMVRGTSQMFITGPAVVEAVTGKEVTKEQLGGAQVHSHVSGVASLVAEDDEECIQMIKRLLSYLPSNNQDEPPTTDIEGVSAEGEDRELLNIVPVDPKRDYDMRDLINRVMDKGTFFELSRYYAPNALTGFARLRGRTIGVVGNQPIVHTGYMDVDSSDKVARFVRFCDAFNMPLITFTDVPGYLPGEKQEHGGIIRHGAKVIYAYSEATVPKITVILRKAYGGGYIAMCSKHLGADVVFAWPTAEIAVMGSEEAVNIIFRREMAMAENPEKTRKRFIEEYREKFANPYVAASSGTVDLVIEPQETRIRLSEALERLRSKRSIQPKPRKKHGNIPL
jgi:acetyl-CoA carboxylase carboxyltransferase component